MITYTPPPIDETLEKRVEEMFISRESLEHILAFMRQAGLHKIDSIKLLRKYQKVSLGEAKDLVHLSSAWTDRYDADEQLHEALEAAAKTLLEPADTQVPERAA